MTTLTMPRAAAEPWEQLAPPPEFARKGSPLVDTEAVPACPVCRGEAFTDFTVGFDYEMLTCRNPWRFVECTACGHVWLNPRPAISALPVIYPPTYYAYNYAGQINPIALRAKELLDRGKMRAIRRALDRAPSSYVDIGCGDGRFLKVMEKAGVPRARCYGLELDEKVVAPLAARGYSAFCERVEDCSRIAPGSIDLATMFHVIEHVDDPGAVVSKVADWLAPGGVFAMETPNLDSLDARLFHDRYWGGYHIPRHWNLFTPDSLRRLLTDRGLEVVGLRFQTGHSFWMYSVHHRLRFARTPRPGIAQWFNPLRGLPFLAAFTAFDKARAALGARTSAMLIMGRKPGPRVGERG